MILFCFPYAGGTSAYFDKLKEVLGQEYKLIAIEYAGHGNRFRESFCDNWDEFINDVYEQMKIHLLSEEKYAFLGYSMGSLVAYELVKRGLVDQPIHFFFFAHNAPHETCVSEIWKEGSDWEIVERMKTLGGFERVNEKVVASNYFKTMCLNPLKADYHLLQCYETEIRQRQEISATGFYSPLDQTTDKVTAWNQYFSDVQLYEMGSNHFFMNDNLEKIREIINDRSMGTKQKPEK